VSNIVNIFGSILILASLGSLYTSLEREIKSSLIFYIEVEAKLRSSKQLLTAVVGVSFNSANHCFLNYSSVVASL